MITVIIPCFNCASFLNRAVESVLSQSFTDWELLLVDNGSTDETASIIKQHAESLPTKIFALRQERRGAPAARNMGLDFAKGAWIQFLDADDELLSEKFEEQHRIAIEGEADVVVGDYVIQRTLASNNLERIPRVGNENVWLGLILSRLGRTSSNLWRTEALRKVQGWREDLTSSQEYDLLFRVLKNNDRIAFTHSFQTIIHASPESVSQTTDLTRHSAIAINYLELRYNMRSYIMDNKELSPEAILEMDKYIYFRASLRDEVTPGYSDEVLKKYQLKVPANYRLKRKSATWFFYFKQIVKRVLNIKR
jgi:glycosyltransferase involved in cell wall biosynthesis